MDVLVNATTCVIGGGIQVAASFIAEAEAAPTQINWHYALSPQVAEELTSLGVKPDHVVLFQASPSRDKLERQRLKALEKSLNPDAVFTIFGPAYTKFGAPHLCGIADGWVTHSTCLAYSTHPDWRTRLSIFLGAIYKRFWLRQADQLVVESEPARQGISRRLGIPISDVIVVPNSCATIFGSANLAPASRPAPSEKLTLLYVSAYYRHKHIEFIPKVAAALAELAPGRDFEFILTIPKDDENTVRVMKMAKNLGVGQHIKNAGPVSLNGVIELYRDAHICFMPSLFETFSAAYPEAMALGRPIVTSDLDFAHAVCRDAAEYYSAQDANHAAEKILGLVDNEELWQARQRGGATTLADLPTARQKYERYLAALHALAG